MRYSTLLLLAVFLAFCGKDHSHQRAESVLKTPKSTAEVLDRGIQTILDSALVKGSVLIHDVRNNSIISNDFDWARTGYLPASTFKITNSIIALETGVVDNDSTILKWNGIPRRMDVWQQDLTLRDAFHYSCVPCYQEIARKIGLEQMNEQLTKLNYGAMEVDSASLDQFWLVGNSRISQMEQVDFLERFYYSELPIKSSTEEIMKRLMVIETNNAYTISGKTGWSVVNRANNGWFVGYLEKGTELYFFATNIIPSNELNMDAFSNIRTEVTFMTLRMLEII